MNKKCNKCGVIKPLDEFSPHKHTKDGRVGICKMCRSIAGREKRKSQVITPRIKTQKALRPPETGPDAHLDIEVVQDIVKEVTRSYTGSIALTQPTTTMSIGYTTVPTKSQLQRDVKVFAKTLAMEHRRHSNISVRDIDIEEMDGEMCYVYTYGMHVQYQPKKIKLDKIFE